MSSANGLPPLYSAVCHWTNLLLAYRLAAKGKRGKTSTATFEYHVADRLLEIQQELTDFTYRPGPYVNFIIHEPKMRRISAATFRDRVVHHALCNVIEPIFERRFIDHSYANRQGKGTHLAVQRVQALAGGYPYVLRADIVKHFPSIDHQILFDYIAGIIRDEGVLWLIDQILKSGDGVLADEYEMRYFPGDDLFAVFRPRGLPIGNLTSQFWSNVYMTPFDRFVTEGLGCKAYLRYVDDFALFADSKRQLYQWKRQIMDFLAGLRLVIHEPQAQVIPCRHGIPWLGFVVYPTYRKVKARNVVKFTRRLKDRWADYCAAKITFAEFDATVKGWVNHVSFADTWGLRKKVLGRGLVFQRSQK